VLSPEDWKWIAEDVGIEYMQWEDRNFMQWLGRHRNGATMSGLNVLWLVEEFRWVIANVKRELDDDDKLTPAEIIEIVGKLLLRIKPKLADQGTWLSRLIGGVGQALVATAEGMGEEV